MIPCVEFEITSNRPDCLSVIGLARETAATYRLPLHLHTPVVQGAGGDVNSLLKVRVENTELCQRYMAAVVRNIKVASSPRWLRERLRACGVRPINNIVDITNYVMLEYGQPMHAFDLKYVKDGQIVVRNAAAGETITTLDGTERELSPEMLVIADAEKPSRRSGRHGRRIQRHPRMTPIPSSLNPPASRAAASASPPKSWACAPNPPAALKKVWTP